MLMGKTVRYQDSDHTLLNNLSRLAGVRQPGGVRPLCRIGLLNLGNHRSQENCDLGDGSLVPGVRPFVRGHSDLSCLIV
jgi:hypothetical protein